MQDGEKQSLTLDEEVRFQILFKALTRERNQTCRETAMDGVRRERLAGRSEVHTEVCRR